MKQFKKWGERYQKKVYTIPSNTTQLYQHLSTVLSDIFRPPCAVGLGQQRGGNVWVLMLGYFLICTLIENVMLDHEEKIKKDRNVRQQELDRVSRDAAPILLETRVEKQLDQGQDTAN